MFYIILGSTIVLSSAAYFYRVYLKKKAEDTELTRLIIKTSPTIHLPPTPPNTPPGSPMRIVEQESPMPKGRYFYSMSRTSVENRQKNE